METEAQERKQEKCSPHFDATDSTDKDENLRRSTQTSLPPNPVGISNSISRDNPFADDGELRRTADFILANSTFSRRLITIVDPDLESCSTFASNEVQVPPVSTASTTVLNNTNAFSPKKVSFATSSAPHDRADDETGPTGDDVINGVAMTTSQRHVSVEVVKLTLDRSQEVTATYIASTGNSNSDTSSESDQDSGSKGTNDVTAVRPMAKRDQNGVLTRGQGQNESDLELKQQRRIDLRAQIEHLLHEEDRSPDQGDIEKSDEKIVNGSGLPPDVDEIPYIDDRKSPVYEEPEVTSTTVDLIHEKQIIDTKHRKESANVCEKERTISDNDRPQADKGRVLRKIIDVKFVVERENQPSGTGRENQPSRTKMTESPEHEIRDGESAEAPRVTQPKVNESGEQRRQNPRTDGAELIKFVYEEPNIKTWKRKILCC